MTWPEESRNRNVPCPSQVISIPAIMARASRYIRVSTKEQIQMRVNHTRERLAKGETALGCAIQSYRSPEIARTFAAAGFDYVFIDMEHGAFNLETVQDMITAAL